ncbi:MAG: glycosyl transferase [Treponema sp.]|jgi:hypothetical protein|nr:glycosyl transferase [Treponema sp.]
MIPKIIHYCWFGGNPLSELAQKCIASWKKYFPDYEIREWNELNYDINKIPYTNEAYNARKYAFVSDYARFDILYQYGGIYFDVDVEVIKPFDDILKDGGFMGFELTKTLGIGCNAGLGIVYQILEFYATLHFVNHDGSYNTHTVVEYVTTILKKYGLKMENTIQQFDGFFVYPTEYFCPKDYGTGILNITKYTYTIHHFAGSWLENPQIKFNNRVYKIYALFGKNTFSKLLISAMYFVKHLFEDGLVNTIRLYAKIVKVKRNA